MLIIQRIFDEAIVPDYSLEITVMQSAIDFGKNFLNSFFNKKDVDAVSTFLADDII